MTEHAQAPAASLGDWGQFLGSIFSTSPDAIVVVDVAGTIVLSSPAVTGLFGYYPEELVGASISTLLPIERRDVHEHHLREFFLRPNARPMGAGQRLVGRRRNGEEFPVDISLAPVEARGRQYVAAFVRDAGEQFRAVSRLHAVNEITRHLLAGDEPESVFPRIAASARALSRSDAVWIVLPNDDEDLEVAHVDGPGSELLAGVRLSAASSISAGVMRSGTSEQVDDLSVAPNVPPQCVALDLGPGLYVPLVAEGSPIGALVFARVHGSPTYSPLDVAFAEVFASSTAAAVVLGESRAELDRLEIVAEDERIARDLHDTVIQQLFALGMSLQATRSGIDGPLGTRIDEAIDQLDGVIREIRNTIFKLPVQARKAQSGLREAILHHVEEKQEHLGFTPRVAFDGPVDASVPQDVALQLLSVLGEALSNVARHAEATSVEVVVAVHDGELKLLVVDDGKGFDGTPSAGSGLRNMDARASDLGGSFSCRARDPRGTILEWRVPL